MKKIKIKKLLKATHGAILFVEFEEDERIKILTYEHFKARFGTKIIKDFK